MQIDELTVAIKADIGNMERALSDVGRDIQSFSRDTARNLQGFDRAMDGIGDSARQAGRDIKEGLGGALEGIETPLGDIGSIVNRLRGPAGFAAIAVGSAAAAKGLSSWADELLRTADAFGISAEELQRWRRAERQVGLETDTLTDLTEELFGKLSEGDEISDDVAQAYEALNVQLRDSNNAIRTAEELLPELIQRLGEIESPVRRAQLAERVLGEQSIRLAGNLDDVAEAMANVAEQDVISEEQLEDIARVDRALRNVSTQIQGFFATGLGSIEDLIQGAREGFQRGFLIPVVQELAEAAEAVGDFVRGAISALPGVEVTGETGAERVIDAYLKSLREGLSEFKDEAESAAPTITPRIDPSADDEFAEMLRQRLEAIPAVEIDIELPAETRRILDQDLTLNIVPSPAADRLIARIQETLRLGVGGVAGAARAAERAQVTPFERALDDLSRTIHEQAQGIGRAFGDVITGARDFGSAIGDMIRSLSGSIGGAAGGLIGSLAGIGGSLVPIIGGAISGIVDFIGSLFGPSETAQRNQQIRDSLSATLREMDVLGQADVSGPLNQFARNLGVKLKDAGLSASTAMQAVVDNIDLVAELFAEGATFGEAVAAVLDQVRADLQETDDGIGDVNDSISDVNDSIQETVSALSNVPQGIKIALARFNATVAGAAAVPGAFGTPAATTTMRDQFHVENLTIVAQPGESGESLLNRIESAVMNRQSRGGGGLQLAPTNAPVTG